MSLPVWMTAAEAESVSIVGVPTLPLEVLIEIRRLTSNCLSSLALNTHEREPSEMANAAAKKSVRRSQRGTETQLAGVSGQGNPGPADNMANRPDQNVKRGGAK